MLVLILFVCSVVSQKPVIGNKCCKSEWNGYTVLSTDSWYYSQARKIFRDVGFYFLDFDWSTDEILPFHLCNWPWNISLQVLTNEIMLWDCTWISIRISWKNIEGVGWSRCSKSHNNKRILNRIISILRFCILISHILDY